MDKAIRDVLQAPSLFKSKPAVIRAFQAARKAILEEKAIGDIRHFDTVQQMNFGSFGPNHVWWNEKEKGGGILGAAGVHSIDQLHYITGQKVQAVNAITQTFVKDWPSSIPF